MKDAVFALLKIGCFLCFPMECEKVRWKSPCEKWLCSWKRLPCFECKIGLHCIQNYIKANMNNLFCIILYFTQFDNPEHLFTVNLMAGFSLFSSSFEIISTLLVFWNSLQMSFLAGKKLLAIQEGRYFEDGVHDVPEHLPEFDERDGRVKSFACTSKAGRILWQ